MRLVATEYISLDGVFEEPGQWSGPYFDASATQFKWDELVASDADGASLTGPDGPVARVRGQLAKFPAADGCHRLVDPTFKGLPHTPSAFGDILATARGRIRQSAATNLILSVRARSHNSASWQLLWET